MAKDTFFKFAVMPSPWVAGSDTIYPENGPDIQLQWRKIRTSDWSIKGNYTSIALSMDERAFYARDADLHVFDVATGNELKVIRTPIAEPRKTDSPFCSILLSNDGQYLFFVSGAKLIYQWDIARQTHVQTYDLDIVYPYSDFIMAELGISLDDRFLCYYDTFFNVVVIDRITNTCAKFRRPSQVLFALQETSWKMDFYDSITHAQ